MKFKGLDLRPLLGLMALATAFVLLVNASPGQDWIQLYGPSVAVACFQLAVGVGIVEAYTSRERARARVPSERQALRHATEISVTALELVASVVSCYCHEQAVHRRTAEEVLSAHPDLLMKVKFNGPTRLLCHGRLRTLGGTFGQLATVLDETYLRHQDLLAEYTNTSLGLAVQNVMHGRGRGLLDVALHFQANVAKHGDDVHQGRRVAPAQFSEFVEAARQLRGEVLAAGGSVRVDYPTTAERPEWGTAAWG